MIINLTLTIADVYLLHACRKQKRKTETTDKNIVISRIENKENSPTLKTLLVSWMLWDMKSDLSQNKEYKI